MLPRFAVSCWLALGIILAQSAPPDPALVPLASRIFQAQDPATRDALLEQSGSSISAPLIKAMNEMAGQVFDRRDYASALTMYQTTCVAAIKAGDRRGQAACLYDQGLAEQRLLRSDAARTHIEAGLALYEEIGDLNGVASALNALANLIRGSGDYRGSLAYFERVLALGDGVSEVMRAQTN